MYLITYAFPPWLPLFFSTVKLDNPCGSPPSVPFADIVGTSRQEYNDGDWVKFKCQSYYKLQDLHESTKCINGQWSNTIKCLGKYTDPAFACALLQSVTIELVIGKCSFLNCCLICKLFAWCGCCVTHVPFKMINLLWTEMPTHERYRRSTVCS